MLHALSALRLRRHVLLAPTARALEGAGLQRPGSQLAGPCVRRGRVRASQGCSVRVASSAD